MGDDKSERLLKVEKSLRERAVASLNDARKNTTAMMRESADSDNFDLMTELEKVESSIRRLTERANPSAMATNFSQELSSKTLSQVFMLTEMFFLHSRMLQDLASKMGDSVEMGEAEGADPKALIKKVRLGDRLLTMREDALTGGFDVAGYEKLLEKEFRKQAKGFMKIAEQEALDDIEDEAARLLGLKGKESFLSRIFSRASSIEEMEIQPMILKLINQLSEEKGNLITGSDLFLRVSKTEEGADLTIEKVVDQTRKLVDKGMISDVRRIDGGMYVIEVKPLALSEEQNILLQLAAANRGELTLEKVVLETKWTTDRATEVLKVAGEKGIARKTDSLDGTRYYFPAFYT